jgi:hypothetical protein
MFEYLFLRQDVFYEVGSFKDEALQVNCIDSALSY